MGSSYVSNTNSKSFLFKPLFHFWLLIALCLFPSMAFSGQSEKVLFLNSYHRGFSWSDAVFDAAEKSIKDRRPGTQIYLEYLDAKRYGGQTNLENQFRIFKEKYASTDFDVVVVSDDAAFEFIHKYGEELFAGSPVVFCGISDISSFPLAKATHVTGIMEVLDVKPTIDLATKLHPNTKKLLVVSDNTTTGISWKNVVQRDLEGYRNLEVSYLDGREVTVEELFEHLKGLSNDTLVLTTLWLRDKAGKFISHHKANKLICDSSPVPVYALGGTWMGDGIVGGKLLDGQSHGRAVAILANRIMDGTSPDTIPIHTESTNPYIFDYTQIKRFGIDPSLLPKDSILINAPFSFYEKYTYLIWITAGTIIFLAVIIILLFSNTIYRIRTERILKESENFLGSVFENIPDMIFVKDAKDLRFIRFNAAGEELLGYSREELYGKNDYDFFPKEEADSFTAKDRNVLESKKLFDIHEEEIQTRKKGVRILHTKKIPILGEDGVPLYLLGISEDITDRKQSEKMLHEKELFQEKLLDDMLTFVGVLDLNGDVIFVNNTPLKVGGLERNDVIGKKFYDAPWWTHSDEVRDMIISDIHQCSSGETLVHDVQIRIADGSLMWIEYSMHPIFDDHGVVQYLIPEGRDISKRKSLEIGLRESECRFRAIFEGAQDGILVADVETRQFVNANPTICIMTGYELDELLTMGIADFHPQADLHHVLEQFEKQVQGEFVVAQDIPVLRKDGSVFPANISVSPLVINDRLCMVGFFQDITIRKQEEKQLSRSLEEKDLLLREIYHRTKNNMYVINSILMLQSRSISDEKTLTIFKETENRIRAMSLVHEKLYQSQDLSNLDLGEYLGDMVKSLVDNMMLGGRIKVDVDAMPVPISIDHAIPFGLVVNEIVTNSLKHAFPDDKSGVISIKLRMDDKSKEIEVLVRDNGIGMPDGFDLKKSSSFGLQTVVNLVEKQLNGTCEIKHNNGTAFFIRFIEPQRPKRI